MCFFFQSATQMGDSVSVHSYRGGGGGGGAAAGAGSASLASAASGYAPVEVHVDGVSPSVSTVSLSGDELGVVGVGVVSPVLAGAAAAAAAAATGGVRRSARRVKGDSASLHSVDRVRFDDHVSYADADVDDAVLDVDLS